MSKVEINARLVSCSYNMLFLTMEKEGFYFRNYEYTVASFSDFNMLFCAIFSCTPNDYVGIADALAKIINGYKAKVLPELSDMPHDVVYLSERVLAYMQRMHRDCLDQLSK